MVLNTTTQRNNDTTIATAPTQRQALGHSARSAEDVVSSYRCVVVFKRFGEAESNYFVAFIPKRRLTVVLDWFPAKLDIFSPIDQGLYVILPKKYMDYPLPDSESPAKSQEASPWIVLLCLVAFMLVGLILGSMLINALLLAQGLDGLSFLGNMKEDASLQQRNLARWANLFPHLFAFTGGALAVALIFFRRSWLQKLQLRHWPNWMFIAAGVLFVLAIFPVAQTSYWLNQQLPLPMWMKDMEKSANELVKVLLHMDSPAELLLNLLTVGVVAALGEELVFRGIVQQQMNKVFKNPILSIWITAIIFSAIHMQFVGFLPRMILGAGLGYLFYWSRSLWLPILVHFLFNSLQVVAYYFLGEKAEQFSPDQAIDSPNWLGGTLGLVILIVVGYYMSRLHKQQNS